MNKLIRFVIALMVVLLVAAPLACLASEAAGDLVVHVENVDVHEPLAFAEVVIIGDRTLHGITGPDGNARFAALPEGRYRVRAFSKDLPEAEVRDVLVVPNEEARIGIDLSRTGPKTIGRVQARYRAPASLNQLAAGDARTVPFATPSDALSLLPGVSVDTTGAIELAGHSAAQTMLSINGVPLGPPGRAVGGAFLRSDLLSSFTLGGGSYGALGGDVKAETPAPTLRWLSEALARAGADENGYATSIRGTAGFVGVSFGHAVSTQFGPLNDETFGDTSGLSYAHGDATTVTSDALKLRVPLHAQLLELDGVSLGAASQTACNLFVAEQPCGFGPGSSSGTRFSSLQLSDQVTFGAVTAWASTYRTWSATQTIGGTLAAGSPYSVVPLNYGATSGGSSLTAAFPARHGTWYASLSGYRWGAFGDTLGSFVDSYDWSQAWLRYDDRISDRTTLRATALRTRINGQGRVSGVASISTGDVTNALSLSYEFAAPGGAVGSDPYVDAPQNLTFACSSGEVIGTGPTDDAALAARSGITASWRSRRRGVETLVQAYARSEHDAPVGAYVDASAVDPVVSPTYLHQATFFGGKAGCGTAFSAQDAFFYVNGTVPRVDYRGVYAMSRVDVGRNSYVQPYVSLTSAVPYGTSRFFDRPGSTVQAGTQLPGVPPFKAGVLADVALSPGRDLVAAWQQVGANNALRTQPYQTLDLAFKVQLRAGGTVTAYAQNLLSPGDRFVAVNPSPIAAGGLRPFDPLMFPLPRRSFGVRLELRARQAAVAPVASSTSVSLTPAALPAVAPAASEAFAVQRSAAACGPEDVQNAQRILDDIRTYAADVARLRAAEPNRLPEDRHADGITLTYRLDAGGDGAVGVGFSADSQRTGAAFLHCALLHGGSIADLHRTGAYVPSREEVAQQNLVVWYASRLGLYVVTEETPSDSPAIAAAPLTATPPPDPFAVNDSAACLSYVRGAAEALLADLRRTVDGWDPRSASVRTAGAWQAVSHGQGATAWLELRLPADQMVAGVFGCATIHAATPAEIRARGFDGIPAPGLNFARALGIYTVVPAPAK
jgi:hypothetical protein